MGIDTQIFDRYFTVIDNLVKDLNSLQATTNALLLQNNSLSHQNNSLLQALLQKPTILQAPKLEQVTLEQGFPEIPENVDVAPQFYYNMDENKYYVRKGTFFLSIYTGKITSGSVDEGIGEGTMQRNMKAVKDGFGIDVGKFDLIRAVLLKFTAFNITTASLPEDVILEWYKNKKKVRYAQLLPDVSEFMESDRSDDDYYWKPEDIIREVITNHSSNTIRVHREALYQVFREISIPAFNAYMDKIRKAFA